jgi:3-methyladenine DNA glycosylase Tag
MAKDIFVASFKATIVTRKWPFIKEALVYFDVKKVSEYNEGGISP